MLTVTTTADVVDGSCDAHCSLREAVLAANATPGADTIVIPAGTYVLGGAGHEDLAASGDLDLRESVTLTGAGADATVIDGGGVDRLIDIVESATVTIRDLTLRNGRVPAGDSQGGGALLWNEPLSRKTLDLRLERVVVTANHAGDGDGGGIKIDQDKPTSAVVTIVDSAVTDNTMDDGDGGGLHLCCENLTATIAGTHIAGNTAVDDPNVAGLNGEGGGIYHCCTDTTLTVTTSTIADNVAPTQGGGIYACCGVEANTLLTLDRTTVSGNAALGTGVGQGFGGGIEGEGAVTLVNVTLSGNRAFRDGGGIENEDVLVLRHVTIAGNEAGRGAGFYEDGLATTLANTLFAGNVVPPGTPANCAVAIGTDPLLSEGGNLDADGTCPLAGPGDRAGVDPLLAPLAANGGPTDTHAFDAASPAADGGRDAACEAVDQRGRPRPADGDNDGTARCDVGAFELGSTAEDCDNGVDDNGNGLVDCADFDCIGQPFCPERCDNCLDDDGDGATDREDTSCPSRSDGQGAGTTDPSHAKPLLTCAAALQKAGMKLLRTRHAALQSCLARAGTCVQRKAADPACLARAGTACEKGLAKLDGVAAKARAVAVAKCGALPDGALRDAAGLGYGADEAAVCAETGVPALEDAEDVAACLVAQHACTAERLAALETPRAAELLDLVGLAPAAVFACDPPPAVGPKTGLGPRGKALDACTRARRKGAAKLVEATTGLGARCAQAVFACRQRSPADVGCLAKTERTCPKLAAKLAAVTAKVRAAIAKKCAAPTLTPAELLGAAGSGFQSAAPFCRALGVELADADTVTECLVRHHRCRADQLLERRLPRVRELLEAAGFY